MKVFKEISSRNALVENCRKFDLFNLTLKSLIIYTRDRVKCVILQNNLTQAFDLYRDDIIYNPYNRSKKL